MNGTVRVGLLRPMLRRCLAASLMMGAWLLLTCLARPVASPAIMPLLGAAVWLCLVCGCAALPGAARLSHGLPSWRACAWQRSDQGRVRQLALLAMFPMMAALPLQSALCRAGSLSSATLLLLHWCAMFVPALLLASRSLAIRSDRARACAALFLAGLAASVALSGAAGDLALSLALCIAWSLAWAEECPQVPPPAPVRASAAALAGLLESLLLLLLGELAVRFGPDLLIGLERGIAGLGVLQALLVRLPVQSAVAASPSVPAGLR